MSETVECLTDAMEQGISVLIFYDDVGLEVFRELPELQLTIGSHVYVNCQLFAVVQIYHYLTPKPHTMVYLEDWNGEPLTDDHLRSCEKDGWTVWKASDEETADTGPRPTSRPIGDSQHGKNA